MADIDEVYHQERLFVAQCRDVHALLDKMAEYRDAQAKARARGLNEWRMRMGDLLELAEARMVDLKVGAAPAVAVRPQVTEPRLPLPSASPAPVREAPRPRVMESRPAAAPFRFESQQVTRSPPATTPRPSPGLHREPTTIQQRQTHPIAMHRAAPTQTLVPTTRPATSLRPPQFAEAPRRSVTATPATSTPEAPSALTGADLARWRTQRGLTQRAAAALLGVAHGTVAKAELVPNKPLGDALRAAMRMA